jgi:hypothetical protein
VEELCTPPSGSNCFTKECVVGTGCVFTPHDEMCDDDVNCTLDTCLDGKCVSTPQNDHCPNHGCIHSICDPIKDCITTLNQTACIDTVACTVDTCNQDGTCTHTPMSGQCPLPPTNECATSICDVEKGCAHTDHDEGCDDGIACSMDSCHNGTCVHIPNDNLCVIVGSRCATGMCDIELGGCVPKYHDERCDDDIPCTTDHCINGMCVNTPTDGLCAGFDTECDKYTCDATTGCVPHPHVELCQDTIPCTIDTCTNGTCIHTPNDAVCVDDDECGTQRCDQELGCVSIDHPEWCTDDIECTMDVCTGGSCKHIPNNTLCHYLNTKCVEYQCDPTCDCIPIFVDPPTVCDDGVDCTTDHCVEGGCVNTPDDERCSLLNTECAIYTCNNTTGCIATLYDSMCDDTVDCTVDVCVRGVCTHTPRDTFCTSDGCVVGVCNATTGCTPIIHDELCPLIECMMAHCQVEDGECNYTPDPICGSDVGCDTAFGKMVDGTSTCFLDIDEIKNNRWGWTNGPLEIGHHTLLLYRGAAQCDITKGQLVGYVDVVYNGTTAIITIIGYPGVFFDAAHAYVGQTILPQKCHNGKCEYIVSPGQFPQVHSFLSNVTTDTFIFTGVQSPIYVVVHVDACGSTFGPCPPNACSDENECTMDLCDQLTGSCSHTSDGCDAVSHCCGETCVPTTHIGDDDCVDSACFDRWCDPMSDTCISAPIPGCACKTSGDCDDGTLCTTDQCRYNPMTGGWYCANIPQTCLSPNLCEKKKCDPLDGQCKVIWEMKCNDTDGDLCTIPTCDPSTGKCIAPEPPTCGPDSVNNQCTHIYCNTTDGTCVDVGYPIGFIGWETSPCKIKQCDEDIGYYLIDKCPPAIDACHTSICNNITGECTMEELPCTCDQIPHGINECVMCEFDSTDQDCCNVHFYLCDDHGLYFFFIITHSNTI